MTTTKAEREKLATRTDDQIAIDRARLRPDGVKWCPKCQQIKMLGEFHKNRSKSDGLSDWCRSSDRASDQVYQERPAKERHAELVPEICMCGAPIVQPARGRRRRFCLPCQAERRREVQRLGSKRRNDLASAVTQSERKRLAVCVSCGGQVEDVPVLGTIPKRCSSCTRQYKVDLKREQQRKRSGFYDRRGRSCEVCGEPCERRQFCSPRCQRKARTAAGAHLLSASLIASRARIRKAQAKIRKAARGTRSKSAWIAGACTECGVVFVGRSLTCSRECSRRLIGRARRAKTRGMKITRVRRHRILERDGWTCMICGEGIPRVVLFPHPLYPTLDHVIPLARGGAHTEDNLQAAHFICNSNKRDLVGGDEDAWWTAAEADVVEGS